MAYIHPDILDNGLVTLTNATSKVLHITTTEATTRANAISASVANKSAPTIASPSDRSPSGRKVTVAAITDGTVTANGSATSYAIIDGTRLLAAGSLASAQTVTNGNTFTLAAFDIGIPGAA